MDQLNAYIMRLLYLSNSYDSRKVIYQHLNQVKTQRYEI